MELWLPIGIVVLSNVFYHVCAKGVPSEANPFLSVMVTYAVGLVLAFVTYLCTRGSGTLAQDARNLNWASAALGIAIVGLEVGNVYMYRAGWEVSMGALACNILLAVALLVLGVLAYHEQVTAQKLLGLVICCVGLWFVSR